LIGRSDTAHLPYRIGLTGNIATGKTTVGRMLEALGAERIDADKVAHAVMSPGGSAYSSVVTAFGPEILSPGSGQPHAGAQSAAPIDRRALGAIVFSDPAALRRLEALVHPAVIRRVEEQIVATTARVVVVEAIKLLESGMAETYEAIWVTACSEVIQRERLMRLRGLTSEVASTRIQAQPPQEEKAARADVVIHTDGSLAETRAQVLAAWEALQDDVR
jgi:dephospho-CoA kinase